MATDRAKDKKTDQQPMDKALGLLASCLMVVFGSWIGLRPETILVRALVVGCVTALLVRMVINTFGSMSIMEDD